MSEMEKAKEYLRVNMLPKLNMILDFADEVLKERREDEYTEEPTPQEKFFIAQLCVSLMAQSALLAAGKVKPGQPDNVIPIIPPDYREVEGAWKNMLADEGFDLAAWSHLEELLTQTSAGQSMLSALVGMAFEWTKANPAPESE